MSNVASRIADGPSVPEHVLRYFMNKTSTGEDYARGIFSSLDLFLTSHQVSKVPSIVIDEAWHAFILHTKDYEEFCMNSIGRFVHHIT